MEFDKKMCPIVDVDGFVEKGKQFDIEINLPEDNRNVIYGVIKDCYGEPLKDAVVKLIEVCGCDRKPVSHTFTDKEGEFVFGPLCPDKSYEVQIWANNVKHYKVCATCKHEGKCLKGVDMNCDCQKDEHDYYNKKYDEKYEKEDEKKCEKKYEEEYEKKHDKEYEEKKCDKEYCKEDEAEKKCDKEHDKKYEREDEKKCNCNGYYKNYCR